MVENAPAPADLDKKCRCDAKCPMTEDGHWVNCPVHQYYTAFKVSVAPKSADLVEAVAMAAAWLRECHSWLLTNDLDIVCPMETDPLDIADALEAHQAHMASDGAFNRDGPCPICNGIEGCSHTVAERRRAAVTTPHTESVVQGEPVAWMYEYRDIYRGRDTGWNVKFCGANGRHENMKDNLLKAPVGFEGHYGSRNYVPLYATPQPDPRDAIDDEGSE